MQAWFTVWPINQKSTLRRLRECKAIISGTNDDLTRRTVLEYGTVRVPYLPSGSELPKSGPGAPGS